MRTVPGAMLLLLTAACYSPKVVGGQPCDLDNPDSCPLGQTCEMRSDGAFCSGGSSTDAGNRDGAAGSFCLHATLLKGDQCVAAAPTTPLSVNGVLTINTSSTNAGNCTEIRGQTGGPSLCLVVASTIDVAAGSTLRAVGPNALVLFAATRMTIAGTVDVSSHVNKLDDKGAPELGAASRTRLECPAAGIDGIGSNGGNSGTNAGGGAGGGSFDTLGGPGGTGHGNTAGGKPVAATPVSVLVGGCPGGTGGGGTDGGGEGIAGAGGGAVYLLAGDTINITGAVNASGSGGNGGHDGNGSSGGGGGGGSGGMIALEAPHIMAPGALFANGGGGGGGGGSEPNRHGVAGSDGIAPLAAAAGGTGGTGGGGDGGSGGILALAGLTGKNVNSSNSNNCAGGGGGGGVGVIHVYGDPAPTIGTISPPKS